MNDINKVIKTPSWFELPDRYLLILKDKDFLKGGYDIGPSWQLMTQDRIVTRFKGLRNRYPERNLYPFARRVCEDDVACFDLLTKSANPVVVVIHDFASAGWELRESFIDFEQWYESAINES